MMIKEMTKRLEERAAENGERLQVVLHPDVAMQIRAALRANTDNLLRIKNQEETIKMLKAEWLSLADRNKELLRAGQAMRDVFANHPDFTSSYDDVYYAAQAWDAATKVDDK